MAIVVVGGGGRGAGKTSLVCAMIRSLPEFHWVAAKVTTHAHGVLNKISKEETPGSGKDTARYLEAGARGAFLLSSAEEEATDTFLFEMWLARMGNRDIIFESNRVLDFVKPDLCLVCVGGAAKDSYAAALERANAIVIDPASRDSIASFAGETRPSFELEENGRLTPELAEWIRNWLRYL